MTAELAFILCFIFVAVGLIILAYNKSDRLWIDFGASIIVVAGAAFAVFGLYLCTIAMEVI